MRGGAKERKMKRVITTYGNPVLRKQAVKVEQIDGGIRKLAEDMIETMYAADGLGLAAQQVGETVSMCVVNIPEGSRDKVTGELYLYPGISMPLVMVNVDITGTSGECSAEEGCLSFPEIYTQVKRAEKIVVEYTGMDGVRRKLETAGLLARVIQHETDHLNGVLLVDRMSPVKKITLSGRLKKLKKKTMDMPADR